MRLLKCILTENSCYKLGKKMTVKGVMVHSTGANNPTIRRYVQPINDPDMLALLGRNLNGNHWNHPNLNVCVHGFIGKMADGSIATVQTLPWDHRGWHAGTGTGGKSANDGWISFEICEDGLTDKAYFDKVYREAVELTAMLCKKYGLDPTIPGVVICHSEGYTRGIASGHADVMHWWPKHGKNMDTFRADVIEAMKEEPKKEEAKVEKRYNTVDDMPDFAKPTIQKLVDKKYLKGTGSKLDLSADMVRLLVILDRAGNFD